jgi:hypothetical protein
MNNEDNDNVGYGKPPKKTQFKKGQSGNPRGRPKVPKSKPSVREIFAEILDSEIIINEGGRKRSVTTLEAMALSLRNRGIRGSTNAIRLFFLLTKELNLERAVERAKERDPGFDEWIRLFKEVTTLPEGAKIASDEAANADELVYLDESDGDDVGMGDRAGRDRARHHDQPAEAKGDHAASGGDAFAAGGRRDRAHDGGLRDLAEPRSRRSQAQPGPDDDSQGDADETSGLSPDRDPNDGHRS